MAKKMSKMHQRARRLYRRLRGLHYKKQGFSWSGHEMWVYGKKADLERENGISNGEKKALHKQGYLSWHLTGPEGRKPLENCLSDKDYAYIYPYNSVYAKWVNDNITLRYILPNEKNHLEYYYQIIQRDEKPLVLRMPDLPEGKGTTDRDILELLKEKGRLLFIPSRTKKAGWYQLAYTEEGYTANKEPKEEEELLEFIKGQKGFYQLMEFPKQPAALEEVSFGWLNRLRLIICNEHGNDPFIADARLAWGCSNKRRRFSVVDMETGELGYSYAETFNGAWDRETHPDSELPLVGSIPNWEQIKAEVLETCLNIRECEYFSVDLALKEDGFGYLSFDACPRLPRDHEMSPELMAYFERKKAYRDSWAKMPLVTKSDLKGLRDRVLNKIFCEPGFARFWATEWSHMLIDDFLHTKNVSLKEKLWCYKHGFLSFHKAQYDLTPENVNEYISDYHYKWLYPINNSFYDWIDDKTTYRYVMEPQRKYLPEYYYHLVKRQGNLCIIPMQDLPKGYTADTKGVLELLREKGMLALKQSSGSHGDGFFKLSYEDGNYYINNELSSPEGIEERISTLSCFYVLTEYLVMHEDLRKIYDKTVNTIRVMAINRHGDDPEIMNAYMRIGAAATGLTDNIGYGGLFCKVDMHTGRYYDAEQSRDHVIVSCPNHPDTGVLIEGYVPMWDEVREAVKNFCLTLPQLEYLGFDVAVTDKGIQILEVNKHQDLHRCNLYGPAVQNFYKEKLALKKARIAGRKAAQ